MGHIKEPKGVDFFVDSRPLNAEDLKRISEAIEYYKLTGKKRRSNTTRKNVVEKTKTS
jgi:tRNA A37 N6-isopentenylltransferase MiaA